MEARLADQDDQVLEARKTADEAIRRMERILQTQTEQERVQREETISACRKMAKDSEQSSRAALAETSARVKAEVDTLGQEVSRFAEELSVLKRDMNSVHSKQEGEFRRHMDMTSMNINEINAKLKEFGTIEDSHKHTVTRLYEDIKSLDRHARDTKDRAENAIVKCKDMERELQREMQNIRQEHDKHTRVVELVERRMAQHDNKAMIWEQVSKELERSSEEMKQRVESLTLQLRAVGVDLTDLNRQTDANFTGVRDHLREHENVLRQLNETQQKLGKQFEDQSKGSKQVEKKLEVLDAIVETQNVLQQYQTQILQHQEVMQQHIEEFKSWNSTRLEQLTNQFNLQLAQSELDLKKWIDCNRHDIEAILCRLEDPHAFAVIGLEISDARAGGSGLSVVSVKDGGPAARAGIVVEDTILTVDGNRMMTRQEFKNWLRHSPPNKVVKLELKTKDGDQRTASVTLGQSEKPPEKARSRPVGEGKARKTRSSTATRGM
eukprot:NODE_871_length_1728_cov_8.346635_g711_i0.p1 GENE.NODE_871_length_1728_cov_8.346635_g711_i0~~NODE_871_length_1728_cov_8.346635_g711_i0.p1  ORF type:complete len:560 (+),score=145.00 NODE_871_length_1728_cov_8.346635_g711_i0:200-1681(+)